MNAAAKLTKRENEIAELFAWGSSKKEVANRLSVSERTIENHARNIYVKIGCGKVNELSAWWFCTRFNISFDLSPLKKQIISLVLFLLSITQMYGNYDEMIRPTRSKTVTIRICRSRRKNEFLTDWI